MYQNYSEHTVKLLVEKGLDDLDGEVVMHVFIRRLSANLSASNDQSIEIK